jgi:hypothetical protein
VKIPTDPTGFSFSETGAAEIYTGTVSPVEVRISVRTP